jgi:hypothetical protein
MRLKLRFSGIVQLYIKPGALKFEVESLRRKVNICLIMSADPLTPELSSLDAEIAVDKIKICKSLSIYI